MRRRIGLAIVSALLIAAVPAPAAAWYADFFEGDASGNATYEEMVIAPQAIYDEATNRTYLAYQGAALDPFVMSYDHTDGSWDGPYRVGDNPLDSDTHGGPAMVIDQEGHIVMFYGGHLGEIRHVRSARPHDVSEWIDLGPVGVGADKQQIHAAYPQPTVEEGGEVRLYYRRDDNTDGTRGDWESVVASVMSESPQWSEPEMLVHGVYGPNGYVEYESFDGGEPERVRYYWYVDVDDSGNGAPAFAAVRRDYLEGNSSDQYIRKGVYYAQRSDSGVWTNARGDEIDPARTYSAMESSGTVVPEVPGEYTNQVVLRRDEAGTPCVLYLAGSHEDGEEYEWRFARWNGAAWDHETITTTDDFFDAGTFEITPDGDIEAFLTTGGTPDDQWLDHSAGPYSSTSRRGGNISHWMSTDEGSTWQRLDDVITSPGAHARYNNPQIVRGHGTEARLLFSEWNNDASSFVHKAYLWGEGGLRQRVFNPETLRLAGLNRIETAIEVSKKAFPLGTSTAVLATWNNFPDALCGVPLAQALRAPVLLSKTTALDPALAAELKRLDVSRVVILGSKAAISTEVAAAIKRMKNSKGSPITVERLEGPNRYETSVAIAERLADLRGTPPAHVVLASGENFPDALAVSPYAARRGYPILLTPKAGVNARVQETIADYPLESIIVVGSVDAVSAEVEAAYAWAAAIVPRPEDRWGGVNRYETCRIIAEHALAEGGHTLERFVVATGTNFPDALCGGLLAARGNGVLLLTQSPPATGLHPTGKSVIGAHAFSPGKGVLHAFVLGGPTSIGPSTVNDLVAQLTALDALASQ